MSASSTVSFARRALGLATLIGLISVSVQSSESTSSPVSLSVPMATGQLVSVISIDPKAGSDAAAARRAYLDSAFRLADGYGLKRLGNLTVSMSIKGDFQPSAVVFYTWPSREAEARFNADPQWSAIKARRAAGWDELRIHDQVSANDQNLVFRSDRFYTLATAWVDAEFPMDYETYLANIEPAVAAAGGRFVYEMIGPQFASLDQGLQAPSRLTLVEWKEAAALDAFLNSEGFKRNAHLLNRGTSSFELLALAVQP